MACCPSRTVPTCALSHSWDVWKHKRLPLEIYGSEGSMLVPDPNFFGGEPQITRRDGDWTPLDIGRASLWRAEPGDHEPARMSPTTASSDCSTWPRPSAADGRIASAARLPLHVLEVLDAFERSSLEGRHIVIETPCERPEKLPLGSGEEVFA